MLTLEKEKGKKKSDGALKDELFTDNLCSACGQLKIMRRFQNILSSYASIYFSIHHVEWGPHFHDYVPLNNRFL